MTYIYNEPADFVDEAIEGFVAAHGTIVRRVDGGVVRATVSPRGQVAVVVGGGSGHYPAFAGLVGQGLAHGAAVGFLLASPSAHQVYNVARAADTGGGVLLSYGNYAGDVLNFGLAQDRLISEGIPCHTVVVTDDISSAPVDEISKRRGVAGDMAVFKIAAASAERGDDLGRVTAIAERANERTRTVGVAFSGCTLPGASEPLFTVPHGRMALGMGIHGEPGIGESDIPSAADLAAMMVSNLLAEWPTDIERDAEPRVALVLNGLGSVKYEELFVLYRSVAILLREAGVTVVEPEVGEMVTTFQMAGVSVTLVWLDNELEQLWRAPASTPAFRKGSVTVAEAWVGEATTESFNVAVGVSSPESRDAAVSAMRALESLQKVIDSNAAELGRLDAVAGDGDHGIGMNRGAVAAVDAAHAALLAGAGVGTLLARSGDAWADKAGGTSGALWGLGLRTVGMRLGDDSRPTGADIARGFADAAAEVMRFGGAQLGDKTLVDALVPFCTSLGDQLLDGSRFSQAWEAAVLVAEAAAEATARLTPRLGRARPHAERSIGTPDPGAVSFVLIMRAISDAIGASR
jgi:D-erythrulose 4-kinase